MVWLVPVVPPVPLAPPVPSGPPLATKTALLEPLDGCADGRVELQQALRALLAHRQRILQTPRQPAIDLAQDRVVGAA